ncbi:hypothetical protein KFE98_15725 [bacterium SCSIO 12741]|nr:hypothetical protein KFE98_15725 [bacterium SCSIO 12741]
MNTRILIWFACLLLVNSSCNTSRSYYKRGERLQEAGLSEEAAEFYYLAVKRNRKNVDATIALKREGQKILENHLQKFYIAHGANDYKTAVYSYLEAKAYHEKVSPYVKLEFPNYYEKNYLESREAYLEIRYDDAMEFLRAERFDQSTAVLDEIIQLDPYYKDARELKDFSDAEPIYRVANREFDAKHFRKAYALYTEVLAISSDYKEAEYFKNECVTRGRLTIAILPVQSNSTQRNQAQLVYRALQRGLITPDNPFRVIIDRENTDELIEEQKLGLTGILDANTAAQTGEMLGAKMLISSKLVSYKTFHQAPKAYTQNGYERYIVKHYDKTTGKTTQEVKYRKITYKVTMGKRRVECEVEVSLISAETGEVVLSEVYQLKRFDQLEYARTELNYKNVYPGTWKSKSIARTDDKVYTDRASKSALDKKFKTPVRALRTEASLYDEMTREVAAGFSRKITQYESKLE